MVADEDAPETQPDSVCQLDSTLAPSINEFHSSFDINSGKMSHVMVNCTSLPKNQRRTLNT